MRRSCLRISLQLLSAAEGRRTASLPHRGGAVCGQLSGLGPSPSFARDLQQPQACSLQRHTRRPAILRATLPAALALPIVLQWQWATLGFFAYVAVVAELQPGLASRARVRVWAGAALGAAVTVAASRLPPAGMANTWILPPALLLLGYWTSGLLFVAPMPRAERRLVAIDEALRIQAIAAHTPRVVAELLELAYTGVYPLIPCALWIAMGAGVAPDRFWTIVLVIDYVCFGMLPWIQTRPPRALGIDAPWRSSWHRLNLRVVKTSSIQVNTFPSGHAAEALAVALLVMGASGPAIVLMFGIALAISAGAVLGRYHYAADAIAGWAVAVAVYAAFSQRIP
jgi:hypothetical protein